MGETVEPRRRGEQRRGEELRHHILHVAKDVFLSQGYERASMDTVAAQAGTSKRSLYAHFESKDKLFLAVLDHVRELYLGRLRTPGDYADEPIEAVTRFCGRFLQLMTWEPQILTCRLTIAEAERLPASSRAYFDAIFTSTQDRLAAYLAQQGLLSPPEAAALAADLLARTVLPRLFRTLLNVEPPAKDNPGDTLLAEDAGLSAIRQLVRASLPA
jgi:AcrR family transcriptional regulator